MTDSAYANARFERTIRTPRRVRAQSATERRVERYAASFYTATFNETTLLPRDTFASRHGVRYVEKPSGRPTRRASRPADVAHFAGRDRTRNVTQQSRFDVARFVRAAPTSLISLRISCSRVRPVIIVFCAER